MALLIDWLLCYAIANAFLGGGQLAILGVFAVSSCCWWDHWATASATGSRHPGPRIDGGRSGFAARGGPHRLLCLVIPAAVFDADQRGLHDRAMGTILVRR